MKIFCVALIISLDEGAPADKVIGVFVALNSTVVHLLANKCLACSPLSFLS